MEAYPSDLTFDRVHRGPSLEDTLDETLFLKDSLLKPSAIIIGFNFGTLK